MSDYVHNKAVFYPVSNELAQKLGVRDVFELDCHPKYCHLFDRQNERNYFDTECLYDDKQHKSNYYLIFTLYHSYGEESGDWGRCRELSDAEKAKYASKFSAIIPPEELDVNKFRYIDYCYYNGCECDDYYIASDPFYDEI